MNKVDCMKYDKQINKQRREGKDLTLGLLERLHCGHRSYHNPCIVQETFTNDSLTYLYTLHKLFLRTLFTPPPDQPRPKVVSLVV